MEDLAAVGRHGLHKDEWHAEVREADGLGRLHIQPFLFVVAVVPRTEEEFLPRLGCGLEVPPQLWAACVWTGLERMAV